MSNREKPQTESDPMFWVAVLVQVLGTMILFIILGSFIGLPLSLIGIGWFWPIMISAVLSVIIWSLILFKTPMFGWWFIYTQPNHRRVLANQITRDKLATNLDARLEVNELASMREIGSGWRGKWPTEYKVGLPINMKSEILVGTGSTPLEVYTKKGENIGLLLHWQETVTPFPGKLVNLVRQSEEAILSNLKAEADLFFIQAVRSMSEDEVFALSTDPRDKGTDKLILNRRFENFYGGDETADPREMKTGVTIKKLTLISITRSPAYQQSAEGLATADNVAQIITKIKGGLGEDKAKTIRPDVLLLMASVLAGKVKDFNPLMITGLDDMDGRALAALLQKGKKTT